MFLDTKDGVSGGSKDLEEEEGQSEEVLSLNSDRSALESIGRPSLKICFKKNRSRRAEGIESFGDGPSDCIAISHKRKWEKEVLPAKAKKKVWDKEVDIDKKKTRCEGGPKVDQTTWSKAIESFSYEW